MHRLRPLTPKSKEYLGNLSDPFSIHRRTEQRRI